MPSILILHKGFLRQIDIDKVYKPRAKEVGITSDFSFNALQVYSEPKQKKVPAAKQKEWLEYVNPQLNQTDYILVSDADYFKTITKQNKAESCLGMVLDSSYTTAKVLYLPSIGSYSVDSDRQGTNILRTFKSLLEFHSGTYKEIGSDIIHSECYPQNIEEICACLENVHKKPEIFVDIEAFDLKFTRAGIATIAFSWDKHNGFAFPVDLNTTVEPSIIKQVLKEFFQKYQGQVWLHKANYDVTVLIYELFQNRDITDIQGQLEGIQAFKNLQDTLVVTYLATNTCAGNILGLKQLAQPFAGHWAVDVSDVRKVPLPDLLRYNLIDCLSTAYVKETYYPLMVQDQQEELYLSFMRPTLINNIRMQLNGLPIDLEKVQHFEQDLNQEKEQLEYFLRNQLPISNAEYLIAEKEAEKYNQSHKKTSRTPEQMLKPFNFSSNAQLTVLVYEVMGLPVIDVTDNKQPSTAKGTLLKLVNHTENQVYKEILVKIGELGDVEKILTAFIPAFKDSHVDSNNTAHLTGFFNLGGTVSGRLSSSQINLNVKFLQGLHRGDLMSKIS